MNERMDKILRENIHWAEKSQHLLAKRGKQLRPRIHFLSCGLIGIPPEESVDLALAIELFHCASLAHDDVLDDDLVRRGEATMNALWGNSAAVLGGNWIYAQAVRKILKFRHWDLADAFFATLQDMLQGEDLQTKAVEKADLLEVISLKTASLFALSSASCGILNNQQAEQIDQLRNLGWNYGMAFQILDDLDDLFSDPALGDLLQGKWTIPIRLMNEHLDSASQNSIRHIAAGQAPIHFDSLVTEIQSCENGLTACTVQLEKYIQSGLHLLDSYPDSDSKLMFEELFEWLRARMMDHVRA